MDIKRVSAFAYDGAGGNPAGVAFCDSMPAAAEMMRIAAEIGYSETAFLVDQGNDAWRVRYFAPETEVPFCGHATIALGAALGARNGAKTYTLNLNEGDITVTAKQDAAGNWAAVLSSPSTWTKEMPADLIATIMAEFSLAETDLDPRLPIKFANGGALHVIVGLNSRETLAAMQYDFDRVKAIMQQHGIITIDLVYAESDAVFHARNAFAIGGVVEDPATGAAAAAFTGYLRDIGWPNNGKIEIYQGFDMGAPSHLTVEFTATKDESVRVSGSTRVIG